MNFCLEPFGFEIVTGHLWRMKTFLLLCLGTEFWVFYSIARHTFSVTKGMEFLALRFEPLRLTGMFVSGYVKSCSLLCNLLSLFNTNIPPPSSINLRSTELCHNCATHKTQTYRSFWKIQHHNVCLFDWHILTNVGGEGVSNHDPLANNVQE